MPRPHLCLELLGESHAETLELEIRADWKRKKAASFASRRRLEHVRTGKYCLGRFGGDLTARSDHRTISVGYGRAKTDRELGLLAPHTPWALPGLPQGEGGGNDVKHLIIIVLIAALLLGAASVSWGGKKNSESDKASTPSASSASSVISRHQPDASTSSVTWE